jgi:hypothetical protein
MKRAFFPMLLVFAMFFPMILTSEARPITLNSELVLTGESGFFLTREDMEVAVMSGEDLNLLQKDYETLHGLYREQLALNSNLYIENNKLEKRVSSLRALGWTLGAVSGVFLSITIWALTR